MKRILSTFFPMLSCERIKRKKQFYLNPKLNTAALLLTKEQHNQQIVVRCCEKALKAGVRHFMSLAHARALLNSSISIPWSLDKDKRTLYILTRLASRYTPLAAVELEEDNCDLLAYGINLDITASQRLFAGEEKIAWALQRLFDRLGFAAQIAVAPTLGSAWGFARFDRRLNQQSQPIFIDQDQLHEQAATLPTAALRLDPALLTQLNEVGITTLQHLLRISPAALLDRFGPAVLTRITQFLGHTEEAISPLRKQQQIKSEIIFESPCEDLNTLELACQELLVQTLSQLGSSQEKVRRCSLKLTQQRQATSKQSIIEKTIILNSPSNNQPYIWSLVHPRLEHLQIGTGIEKVSLTITHKQHELPHRLGLLQLKDTQVHQEKPHALLDTLNTQLTPTQICSLVEKSSHIPERSYAFVPLTSSSLHVTQRQAKDPELPLAARTRPSILLERPLPIRTIALLPDRPPSRLTWQGKQQQIICGIGPEKIDHEWWQTCHRQTIKAAPSPTENRDYFRVQIETGTWLWIFRELPSTRWFIHGLWA